MSWEETFLQSHRLQQSYLRQARTWFDPVVAKLAQFQAAKNEPVLLALNGCQGSGKSTLADYLVASLAASHEVSAVTLSLDDFYCTYEQRIKLAQNVHPLLSTRGVPGTHDLQLLHTTLDGLMDCSEHSAVSIPRFDKARDDRRPKSDWDSVKSPVDIVILEGWCVGALAQTEQQLIPALNTLEVEQDKDGSWRSYVNQVLAQQYPFLHQRVDQWIMLQAPSFDSVYRWRLEQERKLADSLPAGAGLKLMSDSEIAEFIQHYQRITEQCLLDAPGRVNHLFRLNDDREIVDYSFSKMQSYV